MMDRSQPVVLFDGDCALCNASVLFVIDHDREGVVRFAPLQSNIGRRLRERAGLPDDLSTVVVIDEGRAFSRSDATIRISRHLRFPWHLLRLLALIPKPLRDWGYDVVADNRIRWFGRSDACRMPTPALRARLLEA